MRMTSFFGCLVERLRGNMSAFKETTREEAITRVNDLSFMCDLFTDSERDMDIPSFEAARKIFVSMNRWIQGYGSVYVSSGTDSNFKKRIVVKHHIPGARVDHADGPGYDFAHNEYYEVLEK